MLFLSAIIAGLLQLVSHLAVELYLPHLGKLPRYVLGTLCLMVPPSFVVGWDAAQPFWVCAVVSGVAVVGANWLGDQIRKHQDQLAELERMKLHAQTPQAD